MEFLETIFHQFFQKRLKMVGVHLILRRQTGATAPGTGDIVKLTNHRLSAFLIQEHSCFRHFFSKLWSLAMSQIARLHKLARERLPGEGRIQVNHLHGRFREIKKATAKIAGPKTFLATTIAQE